MKVYFTDQNLMQRGDPMKLNFESHEMQKLNIPMGRSQRADEKKGGYLLSYDVYSQCYGH